MKQVYSNVNFKTGTRAAGISEIKIAPREWLSSNPVIDFNTGKITTPIAFLSGKDFLTISLTDDSYDYDEKPKSNKGGTYVEVSMTGTINELDSDLQQALETLRYHEFVAIVKDRQKKYKAIGDTTAAMTLQFELRKLNAGGGNEIGTLSLFMELEAAPAFYEV